MSRIKSGLGSLAFVGLFITLVLLFVGVSVILPMRTSIVYAGSIPACTASGVTCVGNVEFFNFTPFTGGGGGGGGCGMGATVTILNNSHGAGFELSNFGGNPTCTLSTTTGGTFSTSATIEVAGINGFLLDDLFGTFTCGISGGATSGGGALDPGLGAGSAVSVPCPTLPAGSTMLETGSSTFSPTDLLLETITLSASSTGSGAISFSSFSDQFSVVPSTSPVPEPGTLTLLTLGLIGLGVIAPKRLWHLLM